MMDWIKNYIKCAAFATVLIGFVSKINFSSIFARKTNLKNINDFRFSQCQINKCNETQVEIIIHEKMYWCTKNHIIGNSVIYVPSIFVFSDEEFDQFLDNSIFSKQAKKALKLEREASAFILYHELGHAKDKTHIIILLVDLLALFLSLNNRTFDCSCTLLSTSWIFSIIEKIHGEIFADNFAIKHCTCQEKKAQIKSWKYEQKHKMVPTTLWQRILYRDVHQLVSDRIRKIEKSL
jgi:hypothetical protein